MAEFLVIGSLLFWVALAVWIVVLWILVEADYGFIGFLFTVAYFLVLQFAFGVDVFYWSLNRPIMLGILFIGHFVLGACWSVWEWYLFVHEKLEPYMTMKADWLIAKSQTNLETIPDDLKEEWVKYVESDHYRKEKCRPPLVKEYKAKIMSWIGYWPVHALSWTFNDMVRAFVKMIYNSISDWLQSMANSIFAKVRRDLPVDFK